MLEPEEERRVTELIARLAHRFDTARFPPHVTLVSDVGPVTDALIDEVRRVATSYGPIRARVTSVSHSPQRFRAVVIEIDDGDLTRLHDELGRMAPDQRVFRPHVSLLYGRVEEPARRAVVDELATWTPRAITLGSLCVVDTSGDDTDAWRGLASFPLVP